AEIIAVSAACEAAGTWRLPDHTIFTTLEPCPMCAGAIMNSRISRVVFGAFDLRMGACGTKWDILKNNPVTPEISVFGGFMEEDSKGLLQEFFKEIRSDRKSG
ncbi:MAG: nucleoside deaminase, partial [Fibrobacterota bacterium]